jgi:Tol biopolymer transport system component
MMNNRRTPYAVAAVILAALSLILAGCAGQGGYSGAIAYQKVLKTDSQIFVMDPEGEVKTRISDQGGWNFMPSWSPDGTMVAFYYFDPVTRITTVYQVDVTKPDFAPVLLSDKGSVDTEFGHLNWSPDGSAILYYTIDVIDNADIYKVDVFDRTITRIIAEPIYYDYAPSWSPDGTQFVFASNRPEKKDPLYDLFLADANGENLVQLTDNDGSGWVDTLPAWSPDGENIAFWRFNLIQGETFEGGPEGVWLMNVDTREATLLWEAKLPSGENPPIWSPDGQYLAFLEDAEDQHLLQVVDVSTGKLLELEAQPGEKRALSWSPDSRALIFTNLSDPKVEMFILDIKSGILTEVLEVDPGASIGDAHWGGQ